MKRVIKVKSTNFAVADEEGSIITSYRNNVQILDVESSVKQNYDLNTQISFVGEGPLPTIGFNGSIIIVQPNGKLIQYFFPVGLESISPSAVSFNAFNTHMAVAAGNVALVYDLSKPLEKALIAALEGHEANIVKCAFMTYDSYEHLLITCSEDNRFYVWDLNRRCHCYESPFESSNLIKGIVTFKTNQYFALAFEDGFVRLYDASPILNSKPSVKFIKTINMTRVELTDVEEEEEETIVISKNKPSKSIIPKDEPITAGLSPSIINTGFCSNGSREFMLVATANSVISFNINTLEKSVVHTFDDAVDTVSFCDMIVASRSALTKDITVKRLSLGILPELGTDLFPTEDPPEESPLNAEIQPKTKQSTPIATLHKKIKSSGYAAKPQAPPNRLAKKPAAKKPVKKDEAPKEPKICKAPTSVKSTSQPHDTPILTAAVSPDGKRLITSDQSGTVVFVKMKGTSFPAYLGHHQQVTGLSWSTDKNFASCSIDKTIKLWDIDRPDSLLTIDTIKTDGKGAKFPEELTGCSFLWQDKFIVSSCGQNLHLFGYKLPNISSKDIQNMHQTGTYKCISTVNTGSSKIVSLAASNVPKSPVVCYATTAKTVAAVDFYTCQKTVEIDTQHERPIHTVVANYGGMFTPRLPDTPSFVLSAAFDETCRLWDLRSARCERTIICGSRTTKIGVSISPDSRFIAIGTERLGVEIWDIGMGTCVQKIKDDFRGTAVTYLQWNPANGRLISATENGFVKILQ
ncbi:hypothetical protein TVAG_366330 [Trichomonas vaginalis G3]|uniref:WD repeat protein n=1 Tax=Trichomonas vaginalis (strain ATCC PRA-98 / G3) TaxID=412133 RepID=A2DHS7_TRIV3|nr:WD repeat-containing protein 27 family [Trichomonas vaginalis G3]EAY20125.1 hypothetical protein TVAG_366330 [Trichomonas vaginalis G3]KAI5528077.1 WD repeat-containing protein 27 family [Trichomonas vaginalis G3]|eukprot:XP_001581111.1 hypothetical protein [Trichomonas vaginalis G3]